MKTDNHITATALIRKEKILELGGYEKAKRYMNEDWYLWLRMLADNQFPVQVGYYGFWYRRRNESLLTEINDEKKKEYELKMKDIKDIAEKIDNKIEAISYPKEKIDIQLHALDKIKFDFSCKIGCMLETPRACLIADKLASIADYVAFGINDPSSITLQVYAI